MSQLRIYDIELDDLRDATQEDLDKMQTWINIQARVIQHQRHLFDFARDAFMTGKFHEFALILTEAEMQLQKLTKIPKP